MAAVSIDWNELLLRPAADAVPDGLNGYWWVAHTRPRNEKALAEDLAARGIPHYLPLHMRATRNRRSGRLTRSIVPVFTSYLFFNADEDQRIRALGTNRIVNLLTVPHERELVAQLRQIQTVLAGGLAFECGPSIAVGDWVRVVAGPLMGVVGIVQSRRSRLRLVLNVRMLSQSITIEVDSEMLERLDGPPDELVEMT